MVSLPSLPLWLSLSLSLLSAPSCLMLSLSLSLPLSLSRSLCWLAWVFTLVTPGGDRNTTCTASPWS
eukprot:9074213-Alexandrium_andersonii.AAC.1